MQWIFETNPEWYVENRAQPEFKIELLVNGVQPVYVVLWRNRVGNVHYEVARLRLLGYLEKKKEFYGADYFLTEKGIEYVRRHNQGR